MGGLGRENVSNKGEFIQRDRGWHPPAYTPIYKTSVTRSPRLALLSLQNSLSEVTGPLFAARRARPPRQRPHPQLRARRRADRRAHHRARAGAGRERPGRCRTRWWRCGRPMPAAATATRTIPTSPRSTPISAAAGARSPTPMATTTSAPSSRAPIPGATSSTAGGRRTSTTPCSAPASPSGSSPRCTSRATR